MICSLILGRQGSVGFPGKNKYLIRGKPICWYPMAAAASNRLISHHFISTDDPELADIGKGLGFNLIERPPSLSTNEALGEDAYVHGHNAIKDKFNLSPELLVLLFCNAPTVTTEQITDGINLLLADESADSAVTVSRYNMYSPSRARRIGRAGNLEPFVSSDQQANSGGPITCDRNSQGDVWFADVALSVIRSRNLDNLSDGLPPQRWMGRRILPLFNDAGLDIDYEWQLGQIEWWLRRNQIPV